MSDPPESAPKPDQLTQTAEGPLIHQTPRVPLLLDGVLLDDPEEITSYNGTPLYYTPIGSFPTVALAVFTTREAMLSARTDEAKVSLELGSTDADSITLPIVGTIPLGPPPPPTIPDEARFCEHQYQQGDSFTLPPDRAYSDLRGLSYGGTLGIGSDSWNDAITSTAQCRFAVSLFEAIDYVGSELRVPAGGSVPDMVPLGWNDRASSVVNWGFA
ncbi:MAG: hypothetical protein WB462_13635 [Solirubrobacterales bacterium]